MELHDCLEPTFVSSWNKIYHIKSPQDERGKKLLKYVYSKKNDIMSGELYAKKRRIFQLATSSYTNHVIHSVFGPFLSFKHKTKDSKLASYSYNENPKLIRAHLNDSFLNILNVKEQTKTWPQYFHNINTFHKTLFFVSILSSHVLN